MHLDRREWLRFLGAQAALQGLSAHAFEAAPAKPLSFVTPIPLSGGWIRAAVQKLAEGLGQDSIIEDKFGANGLIAMRYVIEQSAHRPMVLVSTNSTSTLNFITRKDLGSGRRAHFKAAGLLYSTPMVLVTRNGAPEKLEALISFGRRHPGKLNYASPGIGGLPHMAALMLQAFFGVKAQHVPQNGSSIVQVLGGHVDFAFVTLDSALPHAGSGKLHIVAVTSSQRAAPLPGIPALAELNPGFVAEGFVALLASAQAPDELVRRLNRQLNDMLGSAQWAEAATRHGASLLPAHDGAYADHWLDKDYQRWRRVWMQLGGDKELVT